MALLQWHDNVMQPKPAYHQVAICFCTLANSDLWEDGCFSAQTELDGKNRVMERSLASEPTAVV